MKFFQQCKKFVEVFQTHPYLIIAYMNPAIAELQNYILDFAPLIEFKIM
jgi:hypothetical protein